MNFYTACIPRIFLVLRSEGNALQVNASMNNTDCIHQISYLHRYLPTMLIF